MELTTEKLIQIIPLADDLRQDLRSRWEHMDPDEKFQVERILWDAYYEIYEMKLEINIQKKLAELGEEGSDVQLGPDFYQKVAEETEKEMHTDSLVKADSTELVDVRQKLEQLMNNSALVH